MRHSEALVRDFQTAVRDFIEPVVRPAGFDLNGPGLGYLWEQEELSALFEAEPDTFARTLPGLMPDYGDEGAGCIDLWIHFHLERRVVEADVEGADVAEWLRDHGHGELAEALTAPAEPQTALRALSEGLRVMLSADSTSDSG